MLAIKKVALVTGANRGLGFGLVSKLLTNEAGTKLGGGYDLVFAGCRSPAGAETLNELAEKSDGKLIVLHLDVSDQESIAKAIHRIEKYSKHLDLLINNAAFLDGSMMVPLEKVNVDQMNQAMAVNATAPLMLTQACMPLLTKGVTKTVVMITSIAGSHEHAFGGGSGTGYAYKMSKSALNMATCILHHEFPEFIVTAINPGGVASESVKKWLGDDECVEEKGWKPVDKSSLKVLKIVDQLHRPTHGGKYINHRYLDEDDPEYQQFLPW